MKTTRITIMVAVLIGLIGVQTAAATGSRGAIRVDKRIDVHPYPRQDLQVWIWPDRGEGAEYFPGDPIAFNVEVTRDCFLILYDIDTRGNLRILFPYDPWDNNFVEAGQIIRFPRPYDGYDWTVDGPPGIEYVQAIASEFPIGLPDWPVYIRSVNHGGAVHHDPELRDFRAGDDHLAYIRVVNRKITGRYWEWCATDLASFIVRRHYQPRVYHHYDPWPDVFYGEIYIGWPVGARIYIDNVYIGVAPLWVPRHYGHGRHVIACYKGHRLLRSQTIYYHPKRDFRFDRPRYKGVRVEKHGHVRVARRGGVERFGREIIRHRSDPSFDSKRTRDRKRPVITEERRRERRDDFRRDIRHERQDTRVRRDRDRVNTRRDNSSVRLERRVPEPPKNQTGVKRRVKDEQRPVAKPSVKKEKRKRSGFIESVTGAVSRSVQKAVSKRSGSDKSSRVSKSERSTKAKVKKSTRKETKAKAKTKTTKTVKKTVKRPGKNR